MTARGKAALSLVSVNKELEALDRDRAVSLADEGSAAPLPVWIAIPVLAGVLAALLAWRFARR